MSTQKLYSSTITTNEMSDGCLPTWLPDLILPFNVLLCAERKIAGCQGRFLQERWYKETYFLKACLDTSIADLLMEIFLHIVEHDSTKASSFAGIRIHNLVVFHDGHHVRLVNHSGINSFCVLVWKLTTLQIWPWPIIIHNFERVHGLSGRRAKKWSIMAT